LRSGSNALPGNSSGDADADAQCATNVSRVHTDYDGSSGLRCFSGYDSGHGSGARQPGGGSLGLLSALNGSKVKRFQFAGRIPIALATHGGSCDIPSA
jgi:hypothetical protein